MVKVFGVIYYSFRAAVVTNNMKLDRNLRFQRMLKRQCEKLIIVSLKSQNKFGIFAINT